MPWLLRFLLDLLKKTISLLLENLTTKPLLVLNLTLVRNRTMAPMCTSFPSLSVESDGAISTNGATSMTFGRGVIGFGSTSDSRCSMAMIIMTVAISKCYSCIRKSSIVASLLFIKVDYINLM